MCVTFSWGNCNKPCSLSVTDNAQFFSLSPSLSRPHSSYRRLPLVSANTSSHTPLLYLPSNSSLYGLWPSVLMFLLDTCPWDRRYYVTLCLYGFHLVFCGLWGGGSETLECDGHCRYSKHLIWEGSVIHKDFRSSIKYFGQDNCWEDCHKVYWGCSWSPEDHTWFP